MTFCYQSLEKSTHALDGVQINKLKDTTLKAHVRAMQRAGNRLGYARSAPTALERLEPLLEAYQTVRSYPTDGLSKRNRRIVTVAVSKAFDAICTLRQMTHA